ncbi:MAG: 5-formyltetrahydrofolate cyclo-ligase [Anaerolineales bacterium]|nr:5-formyltetrahydrofolate cyclo-ligase [Anaerolineae bacterium]PWB51597.1 MAG: 5-formyltetrahydrofolate cyclo-ligase [Anaerolineales bacterium]
MNIVENQQANIATQKRQLRRRCRQIREELGETARQQASQSICAWIENWPVFEASDTILTYMPMAGEVDLTQLMERHAHKQWVLPRIITEGIHQMVFHPYQPGKLVSHPFGMQEPSADLPVIPPGDIQLALVPGVAFDQQGWRLGYGGGYFDRFLNKFAGVSLGVAFQAVLFDQLPHGENDIRVQWIVTEIGLLEPVEMN